MAHQLPRKQKKWLPLLTKTTLQRQVLIHILHPTSAG